MLHVHDEMPRSHNELVDHLIDTKAICSKKVEMAFRCVDRGMYYPRKDLDNAYKLLTWKSGFTNIPSPFVHAFALEFLELKPGHSFLNVGSEVGCLNIMAGLLLGPNGVNHGIEVCSYLVDYANDKLELYKSKAAAIDYHDFCEPKFVEGYVTEMSPTGIYDRVYCGAVVEPEYQKFIRSLVKVGGILITMTENDHLKCKRIDGCTWSEKKLFPVIVKKLNHKPPKCVINSAQSFTVEPPSLQDLCRFKVRSLLRDKLLNKYPSLQMRTKCTLEEYSLEEPDFIYADYMDTIFASDYSADESLEFTYHDDLPMLNNDIHFNLMSSIEIPAGHTYMPNLSYESESEENETSDQQEVESDTDDEDYLCVIKCPRHNSGDCNSSDAELNYPNKGEPEPKNARTTNTISNGPATSSSYNTSVELRSEPATGMVHNRLSESVTNEYRSVINDIYSMTSDSDIDTCLEMEYEGPKTSRFLPMINSIYSGSNVDDFVEQPHWLLDINELEQYPYNFVIDRSNNKLSILLRNEINSLPIPKPLKNYLNYRARKNKPYNS